MSGSALLAKFIMQYLPSCSCGNEEDIGVTKESLPTKENDSTRRAVSINEFFTMSEMQYMGRWADEVRVIFDGTLPPSMHGKSMLENGVPIALVNPAAPDPKYVIIHEIMHHHMDNLGCPSLLVSVVEEPPESSWLRAVSFKVFTNGILVQLWELIQHSRFNVMCGPESARDRQYIRYMEQGKLHSYGLEKTGNTQARNLDIAVHLAVIWMEGSDDVKQRVIDFILRTYKDGSDILRLGESIVCCIQPEDVDFFCMDKNEARRVFSDMVKEMEKILRIIDTKMHVYVGDIAVMFSSQPLDVNMLNQAGNV
ncbi:hypothetical protein GUITHDRAFT_104303 [Guillardia theta CCMP2712]|uniref:Uncharacterized protein n=1 Tax=Guillardia theta (strain CCMP2712) TaxID=905079 RepID=L1JMU1_GUITC|nr:hypothetical protein GUITHDRAFT_104303 [Guillardia theta CCMP2712]EKX49906.1 hypothetical protein GUITHDRAFT_104303 [Guillardia theta CCMP2712]|eukprot:XP_005836886.1 hypothetical protein GUITHDRAFT_104303 [Guillardia theta CCMP2712]